MAKQKQNKVEFNSTFWASMFIMVIMILSIVGFALSGSSGGSSGSSDNVPLGQIFQNPDTGELYWGIIKNGEKFIFMTIEGYDEAFIEKGIANKIKEQTYVEIYVDANFTSSDSIYLIEKAMNALEILHSRTPTQICNENTLVFTTNTSLTGNCIKFISTNEDAYPKADKIVYHMLK